MEITKESTVAEVVSKKVGSDHVFSKYKIDFCCGGGMSLEAACNESGVAFEIIKEEIETINTKISGILSTTDLEIPVLIDQAKDTYHIYISDTLFEILPYASKVAEVHGSENEEVIEVNDLAKGIDEVMTQMLKNSILSLYPIINEIVELTENKEEVSLELLQDFQKAIDRNEIAQSLIGESFKEIVRLSSDYKTPDNACSSYQFLYKTLKELQHQTHNYMHFERNILIPKALKLIE
jgi:regulator of cell morphogenesis and NO signaling